MMRGACVVSGSVIISHDVCVQRDFSVADNNFSHLPAAYCLLSLTLA